MTQNMTDLQDRAIELRKQGYNCAQCVLMTIGKTIGLNENFAVRMAAPFGSGFSGAGEVCGALGILGVVEGLLVEGGAPGDKVPAMVATKKIYDKFKEENGGRAVCRELKGKENTRSCPDLIRQAIRIFFEQHPDLLDNRERLDRIKASLGN